MATTTNLGLTLPTVGADDDTWGTINNTVLSGLDATFAGAAASATLASLLPNYISGLTLSTAGSSATFGIAAGAACDSANAAIMALGSAYTKTTSAWAVGTGNGALDTGAIANSTWYHVWLIQRSGTKVVDVLISTSATSPTMPTNYDRKRRIGAMKTNGSAQWTSFVQYGNRFYWVAPVSDFNTTPSATAAYMTLTVPTGVNINPLTRGCYRYTVATNNVTFWSPAVDDTAATASNGCTDTFIIGSGNDFSTFKIEAVTDTSARVRYIASAAAGTLSVVTTGWVDPRGTW